jgi:Ni/Co efflux regulator RcnB
MKRLLILGAIAAVGLTATAQAQPQRSRQAARQVTRTQQVNNTGGTRFAATGTRQTSVARNYSTGRNYSTARNYSGSRYYSNGYRSSYRRGPNISIGIGTGFGYPGYGYGYGDPYGYGYGYGSPYAYGYGYPYRSTTYVSDSGNVVVAVQQRLARFGYYRGAVDGVMGPGTRTAVVRWEARHGMYANGQIDRQLLSSLGIG